MIYLFAAGTLLFAFALSTRRLTIVGSWSDGLSVVAWAVTVVAEIIGTVAHVSGVVLSFPVLALGLLVVARSKWRLGDLSLFVLVAGMGLGIAYLIAASINPDTGSYGDQGAIGLIALGGVLGLIALWSTSDHESVDSR